MLAEAAEQLRYFESRFLPFPPFVAARDAIVSNMTLYRETGLAKHMLVLGEPGTGKSSLCQWLSSEFPMQRMPERDIRQVLHVSVPPAATLIGIADALLQALGDPFPGRDTTTARTNRIVTLCRNCHVELVLLDEAQHLQDRGDTRTHYLVGDWVKDLIDRIAVPTVMLGLPRLESLLQTNDQLRRRFARRLWLAVGHSDTDSVETECLQLFYSLASLLDLPVSAQPYDPLEMGRRLYFASDGRVAYIKKLLFASLRDALEHDHDTIDADMLQKAFVDEVWWSGQGKLNPFHPDFEFRRLDRGGEPFEHATEARRGGAR